MPPCSTPEKDGHMRSGTFLYKIQFWTIFIWRFFVWCVFLAVLSPKLNIFFHFSTISYLNHINLSSPLAPFCGEIDLYSWNLFVGNSIPYNFYLKLFFVWCVLLAALSPELNVKTGTQVESTERSHSVTSQCCVPTGSSKICCIGSGHSLGRCNRQALIKDEKVPIGDRTVECIVIVRQFTESWFDNRWKGTNKRVTDNLSYLLR